MWGTLSLDEDSYELPLRSSALRYVAVIARKQLLGCAEIPPTRAAQDVLVDCSSVPELPLFHSLTLHLRKASDGSPLDGVNAASLALMEVAVKKKLFGDLPHEPAVVGMRREWPLAVPVGDHAQGEPTSEKRCELVNQQPGFTGVGGRGVVKTDEKAPGHRAGLRTPPYRRSRAAKA